MPELVGAVVIGSGFTVLIYWCARRKFGFFIPRLKTFSFLSRSPGRAAQMAEEAIERMTEVKNGQ